MKAGVFILLFYAGICAQVDITPYATGLDNFVIVYII